MPINSPQTKEVRLSKEDVSWAGDDRVVIRSVEMLQYLVEDGKTEFAKNLAKEVTFGPEAISIDEHGDVIIRDQAFKQMVEEAFSGGPGGLSEQDIDINLAYACISNIFCPVTHLES